MPKFWQVIDIFSYDLPHRIYDAHVYPRRSSNGSTVIVYGHESGLRVVWYAGKKFKIPTARPKVNGHGKNDAMVIDSDSDDGQPQQLPKAEFEDEYDEVDPVNAHHGVLRYLDIHLESPALTLAVPHLSEEPTADSPTILQSNIIVAAACADYCIQLVSLPLEPPVESVTEAAKAGVQTLKLPIIRHHHSLISSLAITITNEGLDEDGESQTEQTVQNANCSFLVASTSSTGSGLLLVHQVASEGTKLGDAILLRRVTLRSPMMAASICFNTASPPADRHSELLITLPDAPCVKVYQVTPARLRNRRGSNATTNSGSTSRTTSLGMSAGKFLVTLLPEFKPPRQDGSVLRKRVLDARWISGGRAILALLEDGEWGIWDLEAAGPGNTNNVIQGQNNVTGIVGGGITKFAIRGSTLSKPKSTKAKNGESQRTSAVPEDRHAAQHSSGLICVASSDSKRNDHSALMSFDGEAQFISSISTYWKSHVTGKGALQPYDRATALPSLRTGGEAVKTIAILPTFPNESRPAAFALQPLPNFLVSTDTRLILHVNPLSEPDDAGQEDESAIRGYSGEQSLLENGDLDLDGVDRYLDDMSRSRRPSHFLQQPVPQPQPRSEPRARPNFGSSMISHDGDVDMESDIPTPVQSSRSFLVPKSLSSNTPRRLFS
jgi:hypothetical protein